MGSNQLYTNSSDSLMLARNAQAQISQKELEIKLLDIHNQYTYSDPYSYSSNRMKRQTIEMEILNLKNNRDMHINNAIDYALILAEQEMLSRNSFSMAAIAIDSISTFLSSQKLGFRISMTSYMKITELSSKLLFSGIEYLNLKTAIEKLKYIV